MRRISLLALAAVLVWSPASAAGWQVSRHSGAFGEEISMAAFADADSGPGRIDLYCDTRDGFRVMFSPHLLAMTEGTGSVVITIDGGAPVTLPANAFGDDITDVVTVRDSDKIETALAGAGHVAARFIGYDNSGSHAAFTLVGLAAEKQTLLKVCPVTQR